MELSASEISLLTTKSKKQMTYYITLDNEDGTKEIVYKLKCPHQEAMRVFLHVILTQQKEYRKPENNSKWRVVRLFDSNDIQIAQES